MSRKRAHASMRANGLVLARDREPGETSRGQLQHFHAGGTQP